MTKTELMETYTSEQLAEMVVVAMKSKEDDEKMIELITSAGKDLGKQLDEKRSEIEHLQSEAEKYRKEFEDTKKECDCRIAEYQKRIENLEHDLKTAGEKIQDLAGENMKLQCERNDYKSKSEFLEFDRMRLKKNEIADFLPTEPIKVADMLINASKKRTNCMTGKEYDKYIFEKWQLRQIAEHLLVYCNHNGEAEE